PARHRQSDRFRLAPGVRRGDHAGAAAYALRTAPLQASVPGREERVEAMTIKDWSDREIFDARVTLDVAGLAPRVSADGGASDGVRSEEVPSTRYGIRSRLSCAGACDQRKSITLNVNCAPPVPSA